MLAGQLDGVCADEGAALASLRAIRQFAMHRPTVYLPTHDPESSARLSHNTLVEASGDFHDLA